MIFWQSTRMYGKVKYYVIRVGMLTQGESQEFPRLLRNPNPKVHYLFHAVVSWAKLFTHCLRQVCFNITLVLLFTACRSPWPCRIRHGSASALLLGLRVWIPPRTWTSLVSVVCYQVKAFATGPSLVQRSLYRVWCVWVWSGNLNNEEAKDH